MNDRIIRESECEKTSGLSRTTRWRLESIGLFPKRRVIGPNSVGWLESEITEWQENLPRVWQSYGDASEAA